MKKYNILKGLITILVCLAFAYVVGVNSIHEGEVYKVFLGQVTYVTYAHRVDTGLLYMFNTLALLYMFFIIRYAWKA